MYSDEFPKFKSTLKEIFFEELAEMENGKWKCPHILYVEPSNEGFIIPLILYGLISASYPSHKICMKEVNNRKETIQFF